MADISKIELLDGSVYNIKDAAARESIPEMATALPQMDGEASAGTSEKYAKEDHVHPSDDNKLDNYISSASGNIVTFHDGANGLPLKKLVAQITPVQDLHGQDAPYPPGGGRNLLPMTLANMKSINSSGIWNGNIYALGGVSYAVNVDNGGNVESITVNGTATAYSLLRLCNNITFDVKTKLRGCPASSYSGFKLQAEGNVSYQDIGNGVNIPENTALTRIIISFPSGISASNAVFYPRVIDRNASDQSYAPYSNECPISGWTGMNGRRTGKNRIGTITLGRINQTTGQEETGSNGICDYIRVNANDSYVLSSFDTSALALRVFKYDKYKNYLGTFVVNSSTGYFVVSTDSNTAYVRLQASSAVLVPGGSYQFESGSSPTALSPYSAESISVSWQDTAGTVYGGTMTVNEDGSGELVSARAKKIFDGTEALSYNRDSATSGYAIYRLGAKNAVAVSASGLSNILKPLTSGLATADWSQMVQNSGAFNQDQIAFRFTSDFDGGTASGTVTNYKAELARLYSDGTPLEVCYELATPQTYHFDNLTQLTTLLGTNNIWVDTGDVSVTYYNQNLDSLILNNIKALNGHTVNSDVPANAVFTDTTYESKTAVSGGTDVSLVTTGEKATWNGKVNISQGTSNAGKFLVVGSDGNVTTVTMTAWQGGSY